MENKYSAKENSGSFTVITNNTSKNIITVNVDTDIEANNGFNEYIDDPEEGNIKAVTLKPAAEFVSISSIPPPCLQSSRCSTQCASTYRNRRKTLAAISNDAIKKSLVSEDSDDNSSSSTACMRKISKFRIPEKKLIEGRFKHITSINYEEYLAAIGTGPCSQDLVMKAGIVLIITQVIPIFTFILLL
jgi:copper(I)-binding protein